MTTDEKMYFDKLVATRQSFFNQIQEAEKVGTVEGYWDSVVDKYSDQAHFIYEVLQNADDAEATKAHFELFGDHLVFRHNGKRRFSVSDPETYQTDRKNSKVGDINGITSIGGSGKFLDDAKIGKFGLGFKAVFQYSLTPSIYDGNISFKIHNYIIPELLNEDYPGRHKNETIFVFPFDRADVPAKTAYEDIKEKLYNLIFPNLFLNNLEEITYECYGDKGVFKKKTLSETVIGNISAQLLRITKGSTDNTDKMWLFSRTDKDNYKYSVGFFTDKKGVLSAPERQYSAFCFFPTLVTTNLNFVIHAPFLLTDNREGIMAGNEHNKKMIANLAQLAADGIECLCNMSNGSNSRIVDDGLLDVIPLQENVFAAETDRSKVSFMPFYRAIKEKLQEASVLPTRDGYTTMAKAHWGDTEDIPNLISDEQLSSLLGKETHFVFVTKGRNSTMHFRDIGRYIDSIVNDSFDENDIYRSITAKFIEKQGDEWLILFYRYILEGRKSAARINSVRKLPIFLDTKDKAIAAYDSNDHECLFLPDDEATGYPTINERLYEDQHVKKLLKELEIKKPEQGDRIFNKVIPKYVNGVRKNGSSKPDFRLFLEYFVECESNEKEYDLIKSIRGLSFIEGISADGKTKTVLSPARLYYPTEELKNYFANASDIFFVDLAEYEGYISQKCWKHIDEFLDRVGVFRNVRRVFYKYTYENYEQVKSLFGSKWPNYAGSKYKQRKWTDARLQYGEKVVKRITSKQDRELSVVLWNQLKALYSRIDSSWKDNTLGGIHVYPYYGDQYYKFDGLDAKIFRNKAWLINKNGEFVAPKNLQKDDLADIYTFDSYNIDELFEYLGIVVEDYSNLTDLQRKKMEIADKVLAAGGTVDDVDEFFEWKRQKMQQRDALAAPGEEGHPAVNEDYLDDLSEINKTDENEPENKLPLSGETKRVIRDIASRTQKTDKNEIIKPDEDDVDEDEYTPSTVDYQKKIDRAKEKSAAEIEKITYWERLNAFAQEENRKNKYSFKWFNTLLEMESILNGDSNSNSREISISFAKVEREPNTKRTLILKHPNRYIPHFMEDLSDIPLVLHIGDQTRTVVIEVANVQSYTLRVKLRNADAINGLDLNIVTSATIDAKSPVFLLDELRKQFNELNFDENYNLQTNLPRNIEFVFGPPGTGKTTHLAKNVLIPLMQEQKSCKVLVLTPTNKSADVLVRRIMEVSGEDQTYSDWLVRFGTTSDEEIEQSTVYRDKSFDISSLSKSVTVTTIARFPYDFFMTKKSRLFLYAMYWDYIIIDEASMIPIANIVFPLYKKTPKKFIIAGDPFQIEPITAVNTWKNENIYTMVQLDSFESPTTIPYQYNVELLTTQYRSIPDIGDIFSNFAYGGILEHYRTTSSQRKLNTGNDLGIETLNIIKYPVSKYESIYRCKRLQHSSSYQVYSALFVFEYVSYISRIIASNNPGELYKIGIIAPYRAQADMIDKLLASEELPKETDVQVGTIHGFQGDECDIIFAVFNTPPTISDSREMFLNKKNIINVSISRAKDYLFIVMPDDNTENISRLTLIKRVENLIKSKDSWQEFASPDLEDLMFGDSKYLENNAFSTSHQSVNVYGLPEKYYEVRAEDAAVDVQIHKEGKTFHHNESPNSSTVPLSEKVVSTTIDSKHDYNNPYDLDESKLPFALRKTAIDLPVSGALEGWFYLVPYPGKLSYYIDKKTEAMFVPVSKNGKSITIPVSVIRSDRLIFMFESHYKKYELELGEPEGITIIKTPKG